MLISNLPSLLLGLMLPAFAGASCEHGWRRRKPLLLEAILQLQAGMQGWMMA